MENLNVITKSEFKKVCFQILLKKFDVVKHVLNSIAFWYIVSDTIQFPTVKRRIKLISFSSLSEIKESNYKKLKMIRFPNTLYK